MFEERVAGRYDDNSERLFSSQRHEKPVIQ